MENDRFQNLLSLFKALADESRLKILGILANRECSVEELAVLLKLKEPTISHHLAKLKQVNLVSMHPEGNTHLYKLHTESLQNLCKETFEPNKIALLAKDINIQAWEIKILHSYIEGDFRDHTRNQRLKEIPISRKKRLVILAWLAKKFEQQVQYPEDKVNEIIKCYHPNYGILRQELIDNHFMNEHQGMYRLLPVSRDGEGVMG